MDTKFNVHLILLHIIIILILVELVRSTDYRFEACKPKTCGSGPTIIRYPFWIQDDYCGQPGFGVTCKNNDIILYTLGYGYIIREIDYENKSLRVENPVVLDKECPVPFQNSTFSDQTPFTSGFNVRELSFYYKCSKDDYHRYEEFAYIVTSSCASSSSGDNLVSFAIVTPEGFVMDRLICESLVRVPVELDAEPSLEPVGQKRDYMLLLKKGFPLEWDKASCTECEASGGYCGFHKGSVFVCFCNDQPRYDSCNGASIAPDAVDKPSATTQALALDYRFEDCKPKHCGNGLNISYPFWIKEDYCGYPGFKVTCWNDEPIIYAAGYNYIIRDIHYANRSFRVENPIAYDACPVPFINSTFNDQSPFKAASGVEVLSFFYNCTHFSHKYDKYIYPVNTSCVTLPHGNLFSFAGFVPAGKSLYDELTCQSLVNIPIEGNSSLETVGQVDGYLPLLRKGFTLEWEKTSCTGCQASGGYCGVEKNDLVVCFCEDQKHHKICPGAAKSIRRRKILIGLGVVFGVVGIILSISILIYFMRKKRSLHDSLSSPRFLKDIGKNNHQDLEAFFKTHGSLAPKRYSFKDVKKMTNSFKEKLGQGGYGSVFKGKLNDGRLVAVKVLFNNLKTNSAGVEFINEVASISRTSHVNIVTLLGFCYDKRNKRALIYEFMPNGSLEKFIYGEKLDALEANLAFGWETVFQVAIEIARGLEYLHRGCTTRILHFDIKPHNILLDEGFRAKISDFGLAKLCLEKESFISMSGARGTAGYIAPEVFNRNFGGVSNKSDVYSYGMMILEMVGGRKNIDVKVGIEHPSQLYFPHQIYDRIKLNEDLGLHGIMTEERKEAAKKMIIVGLWCIQTNPLSRPSMSKVLEMLEGSLDALEIPPKPFLSSPPRSPQPSISSSTSA